MGNRGYALTSACPDLHSAYDKCEKTHLELFRRGEASIDNPCRDEWEDYKLCVMEVWDAKTREYLARRAVARGDAPPPQPSTPSDMSTSQPHATFNATTALPANSNTSTTAAPTTGDATSSDER